MLQLTFISFKRVSKTVDKQYPQLVKPKGPTVYSSSIGLIGSKRLQNPHVPFLQEALTKVKGDLHTAQREEVHAKKRLEVEKFSSKLDKVSNRADMASSLFQARLGDQQKQLMNLKN
mgnify:CR=1 FL=1